MNDSVPSTNRTSKIHIIYFVDSKPARNISIGFLPVCVGILSVIVLLVCAGLSIYLYVHQRHTLNESLRYVTELKASLIAQNVIENKIFDPKFLSSPYEPIPEKLVQSFLNPSPVNRESTKLELPSNAKVEGLPPSQVPPPTSIPSSVDAGKVGVLPSAQLPKETASPLISEPAAKVNVSKEQENTVLFSAFRVKEGTDDSVSALSFHVVNPVANSKISGTLCAVVVTSLPSPDDTVTFPEELELDAQSKPDSACVGGLSMRLNRLRPTEISVSAASKDIRKVTLYFSEKKSGKTSTQSFKVPN